MGNSADVINFVKMHKGDEYKFYPEDAGNIVESEEDEDPDAMDEVNDDELGGDDNVKLMRWDGGEERWDSGEENCASGQLIISCASSLRAPFELIICDWV